MMNNRWYTFKKKADKALFVETDIMVQMIFIDLCTYCHVNDIPQPIITSTIRPRMAWSVSDTHSQGRAIDLRSWIYDRDEIDGMCSWVNDMYADEYGTGPEGRDPLCLIYEEDGDNSHLHLQVSSGYTL